MDTRDHPNATRTLLVPLDATAFSRKILDQVLELFSPDRFRIALLHVAEPPVGAAGPYRPAAVGPDYTLYAYDLQGRTVDDGARESYQRHALYEGHANDEYRERLQRELEHELSLFRSEGYEASATVHFGDPVTEIVAFARDASIAAIAMATHGRTGIGRLLQGSVAQEVFARLERPVPVLLLRPGDAPVALRRDAPLTSAEDAAAESIDSMAMLGGLSGTGSMVVHRRPDGGVEEAKGRFVPADGAADLEPLREAQRENLSVAYDGPIVEPGDGSYTVRKTDVFITRIREAPETAGDDRERDSATPVAIEFAAAAIVEGDVSTQRSSLPANRDVAAP